MQPDLKGAISYYKGSNCYCSYLPTVMAKLWNMFYLSIVGINDSPNSRFDLIHHIEFMIQWKNKIYDKKYATFIFLSF